MIYTIERSQILGMESAMIRFNISKFLDPYKCESLRTRHSILEMKKSSSSGIPLRNMTLDWSLVRGALLKMYEIVYPFSTNLEVDIRSHHYPERAGMYLELGYNFISKTDAFNEELRRMCGLKIWTPMKEELNIELINKV